MATRRCTTSRSASDGVYDKAVEAIRLAKAKGFRVSINCTLFNDADPAQVADFFDEMKELGLDGITVSPGYAYERAPDQQHFLNRTKTKELFRGILERGEWRPEMALQPVDHVPELPRRQRGLSLHALGQSDAHRLRLAEALLPAGRGLCEDLPELMDDTEWDKYGVGNYEKCADCMVHCGFEASAVKDMMRDPLKALRVAARGVRTEGRDGARTSPSTASGRRSSSFRDMSSASSTSIRAAKPGAKAVGSRGVAPGSLVPLPGPSGSGREAGTGSAQQ